MPLFRSVTAQLSRRHALVWACSALLVVALAAISGAFAKPVVEVAVATHAGLANGLALSGDREAPPQRIADECTESLKRRRVCSDWLTVAVAKAETGPTSVFTFVPVIDVAAPIASSIREPFDGDDAFRVEPCDWSATRLRVCLGRAPPIA